MNKVEFYKHNLSSQDIKACLTVLKSFFLTTGKEVKTFEENFSTYLGIKYTVGVTSCTDALIISLKGLGIQSGDEVITTPLSFIATANAIEHCGAKPVFVDVEKDTGNIDASLIEKAITKKTKAILVVHLYGQMCDMKSIAKIAKKHKLKVIEDAAHCIEGERDGIRVGQLSDATCFSFYATKNLTSGEGGAISTKNKQLYEWLLKARLHGMSKNALDRYTAKYEHYDMDILGFKCNMNNIQASLLIHQLDKLEKFLKQKKKIYELYSKGFAKNTELSKPAIAADTKHAHHLYTIWVNPKKRDDYLHQLQEQGIGVAVNFRPIHYMSYYKKKYGYKKGMYPNAEYIGDATISLPFYPKVTKEEIQRVIHIVNKTIK